MKGVRNLAVGSAVAGLLIVGAVGPLSATQHAGVPQAVSPSPAAGLDEALVEVRCPTFSWSGVEGARGYELVVLVVGEGNGEDSPEPRVVTRATLSGDARGWTPSLGNCVERGRQYAWSVRAVTPAGEGAWSAPALFRVAAGPSVEEVEAAMKTLRRFVSDQQPEGEVTGDAAAVERRAEARRETSRQGLGEARDRRASDGQEGAPARQRLSSAPVKFLAAGAEGGPELALASAPVLGSPSLSVNSNIALGPGSNLFKDGAVFLWDDSSNTALGRGALGSATGTATYNTAVGREALANTTQGVFPEGSFNTALGDRALDENTTGFDNTASGHLALASNTTGSKNTATGSLALVSNTSGSRNTAIAAYALNKNTSGERNTAVGFDALFKNTAGSRNVAIGFQAGYHVAGSGRDDNIFISNRGVSTDSNTIRIGGSAVGTGEGQQDRTFINGISGVTVSGSTVLVSSSGQLGVSSSSASFKKDIEELDEVGERLAALRPVTFRYRSEVLPDGGPQVGLIAEEVAALFPELVTRDAEDQPFGVRYDLLSVLSLAELQQQMEIIRAQATELEQYRRELARHRQEVATVRGRLSAIESTDSRPRKPSWWHRGSRDRDSP